MPVIYQTCETSIEKSGPCTGNVTRPVAFCDSKNTASILCDAIGLLAVAYRRHYLDGETSESARIILTKAGLI